MTEDLESTLAELGGEYRRMVVQMKAAYAPKPWWRSEYLKAAAIAGLFLLPTVAALSIRDNSAPATSAPREYLLAHVATDAAIAELVRTQRPDGGWANDFLTRQNAQALAGATDDSARLAYRKAMRHLRLKGYAR